MGMNNSLFPWQSLVTRAKRRGGSYKMKGLNSCKDSSIGQFVGNIFLAYKLTHVFWELFFDTCRQIISVFRGKMQCSSPQMKIYMIVCACYRMGEYNPVWGRWYCVFLYVCMYVYFIWSGVDYMNSHCLVFEAMVSPCA